MRIPLALVLLLVAAACGEDKGRDPSADFGPRGGGNGGGGAGTGGPGPGSGGGGGGGSGGGAAEIPVVPVHWGSCPFGGGTCTSLDVPLDWSNPEGRTIPFVVRRYETREPERKGQLWLLEGGPGSAGWSFTAQVGLFQALAPGFDLYIPDYRGAGYSAWLGCAGEDGGALSRSCMTSLQNEWGEGLHFFTTSDAARDIALAMQSTRTDGDALYLYGISYGTFVGNRFLTLFPDLVDAAVLDSVCPPSGCDVRMDHNFNRVAEHVFELCGADTFCGGKLGADPWATFGAVLDSLAAGHCGAFLGYPNNRVLLEQLALLAVTDPTAVPVALSSIYRTQRCSAEDVTALDSLVAWLSAPGDGFGGFAGEGQSAYLSLHVVFSEFWPDELDRAKGEAELSSLRLQMGTLATWLDQKEQWTWPASETPAELYRWAATDAPLLLLNGTLDGQTHVDGVRTATASFRNDRQRYVEVPLAGHSVLYTSAASAGDPQVTCGMAMIADFFADPSGSLDTSCVDAIGGLDFRGSRAMAQQLYGTGDLWENGAAVGFALPPQLAPRESRALGVLRKLLRDGPGF